MPNDLKDFGDIAKKLSANPLGIIALFIVLVYGIAALVIGMSAINFKPGERLPLIWFLVLFPPIVLFTFAWLVAKHHVKLYAPKDYPDPTQFLQTLNTDQQRKKLESEVDILEDKSPGKEISKSHSLSPMPRNVLMSRVLLAEDLVLRELSAEYGVDIRRQMSLGGDIGIDGMFVKDGKAYGVEVKYFRNSKNVRNIVESLRRAHEHISGLRWKRFNLILAAVIDDAEAENVDHVKERIDKAICDLDAHITIRYFYFSELTKKYGASLSTTS